MRRRWTLAAACLLALCSPSWGEDETVLFDFEGKPSADWQLQGQIQSSGQALPALPVPADDGPAGLGVRIQAGPGTILFTRAGKVARDWRHRSRISFWVYRAPAEAKLRSTALEVWLVEDDKQTHFWRKVDLNHSGWRRFDLPLRWFRWSPGRAPRMDQVDRLGFWFRDAGDLWLDRIAVTEEQHGARVAFDDLAGLAFPGQEVRRVEREDLWVLTDCEALDLSKLDRHLRSVAEAVRGAIPALPAQHSPPALLVFSKDEDYRRWGPRLARQFNSRGSAAQQAGYTVRRFAASAWRGDLGTLRPVFTHEFVHAFLSCTLGWSPHAGDWLQEGLATLFQRRFHPQDDLAQVIRKGLTTPSWHMPLPELCNGQRIPTNRYWQAMTLWELLLEDPWRARLPKLFEAILARKTSDLGPHLGTVLGSDWTRLTAAWRKRCERY